MLGDAPFHAGAALVIDLRELMVGIYDDEDDDKQGSQMHFPVFLSAEHGPVPGGLGESRYAMHFRVLTKAKKQDTGVRLELARKCALCWGGRGVVDMNTVSKPGPLSEAQRALCNVAGGKRPRHVFHVLVFEGPEKQCSGQGAGSETHGFQVQRLRAFGRSIALCRWGKGRQSKHALQYLGAHSDKKVFRGQNELCRGQEA